MAQKTDHERGTITIDRFDGQMIRHFFGDANSGKSWVQVVSGQNPFVKPGQLTWSAMPTQIDVAGAVITDMIVAMKERVETGVLYVYAIGHTGRLYKIQVNDPNTYNPDYDNPVLLTTLTQQSPTFTKGGFMDFAGATQQIIIGHDKGATKIDFAGTNETFVGALGSWTQSVPRPIKQFQGKVYFGNGTNIAEMDSTNTITTYTKFAIGFPTGSEVRDIDLTSDGNYLEMVVSSLPLYDITSTTQETSSTSNASSFIMKWNGSDTNVTSLSSFPSYSLDANTMFQNYQYTFGTDQFGSAVYNPVEKIIDTPEGPSPLPNAIISSGNLLLFAQPLQFNGVMEVDLLGWGSYNFEVGHPYGFWDLIFMNATSPETDIIRVPAILSVSNEGLGGNNNYANGIFGTSKIYISTLETSLSPTTKYRFYKWSFNAISPSEVPAQTPQIGSVYQTQVQMFSKKVSVSEVRVYGEPWIAGNAFTIDLIGADGNPIVNGSKSFIAGTNMNIGDDFAWYGPDMIPVYAIGVRITQDGTTNHTINKIEIDWGPAGK